MYITKSLLGISALSVASVIVCTSLLLLAVNNNDIIGVNSAAPAGGEGDHSNVVVLTDENFEHDTQASTGMTTGAWFVKFYAPWCGHCKNLAPTWGQLANDLKGKINIAKVDCTQNSKVCKRFKVEGFPALHLLRDGRMYEYSGERSLEALKKFATDTNMKSSGNEIPPVPTLLDDVKMHISEGLTQVERVYYHAPTAFYCIFLLGMLACALINTFLSFVCGKRKKTASSSSRRVQNKKKD